MMMCPVKSLFKTVKYFLYELVVFVMHQWLLGRNNFCFERNRNLDLDLVENP